jgi:hypothetical protein
VDQLVVAQTSETAKEPVDEGSIDAKLRPAIETVKPAERGWLHGSTRLPTGASKVSTSVEVPAITPTVRVDVASTARTKGLRHVTVDVAVHAVVPQAYMANPIVTENSYKPKLSPDTVTELPPLTALFSRPCDSTAASKLYPCRCVPDADPTVTAAVCRLVKAALERHSNAVADVHAELLHAASDSAAVAERS